MKKKKPIPNYILRVVKEEDKERLMKKIKKYRHIHKHADALSGSRRAIRTNTLAGPDLSIFPKPRSLVQSKINLKGTYVAGPKKIKFKTPSAIKGALKTTGKVLGGGLTALWVGGSAKKILNYGSHKPF